MKHSWFANGQFSFFGTLEVKYVTTRLHGKMIIQIRHLNLVNREWFTLPVNVWPKVKTAISNKFSINIIPKKQQIGNNNNNNDDDNSDSNDNNNNKILYWENNFSWKLTMSEISLNSFENCTISSKLQLWATSKFSLPSLYEQKCFLFFTQKMWFMGEEITHENDTANTL